MERNKDYEKAKETLGNIHDTIHIIRINKPITQYKKAVIYTDNDPNMFLPHMICLSWR